ncbi:MAG: protein-L-isoaspartate(D-aspartate) O-methyltransferase [Anaerolineales bacterium]
MRLGILLATSALIAACAEAPAPSPTRSPTQTRSTTSTSSPTQAPLPADSYIAAREKLVETGIIGYGIQDPAVIRAMRTVPRHKFVPSEYRDLAYGNHPLPIGYGQTISQPYIVALMTEALDLEPGGRVLEIGTGSGYQAAVLAELGMEVYSIEIVGPLSQSAAAVLEELGYDNLDLKHADGYFGWEEAAPFDAIIVTAAPDHVPQPLLRQLKVGGILVIPVGPVGGFQELWSIRRVGEDVFENSSLGGVTFVPFVREAGSD